MKERPILFSGEMVRAILEGRKTQTRRIVKPQPDRVPFVFAPDSATIYDGLSTKEFISCPYGIPGDRLWVRHDFYKNIAAEDSYNEQIWNPYTKSAHWKVEDNRFENGHPEISDCIPNFECGYWKHIPSIHMPRWASRILLEIVAVRVERLQDISEEDAEAEGISQLFDEKTKRSRPECNFDSWTNYLWHGNWGPYGMGNKKNDAWHYQYSGYEKARDSFSSLWESINGPGSWEANPWVWVIEFRKVKP